MTTFEWGYQVLRGEQPRAFLGDVEEKTERIVTDHLRSLEDEPFPRPGSGRGDRERLPVDGDELYRLHISRTYTNLYTIDASAHEVRVREIVPIDEAHKRYGY
ncbi:MAG: type II toxin-antitoxin system RelE/ParE family toxin [Halodesulfurarchaeum sp.]|nr:type II toxin-antitoxin system RelE/ParE family toxin [Halodesulfurarchaeum sp.]